MRVFSHVFHRTLAASSPLLDAILRRVGRHIKGQVEPVLILLVTGTFNAISVIARLSTLNLRLLRATSLIRSSIISRTSAHHRRTSIGTVCSGHISILIKSFVLTATLSGVSRAGSPQLVRTLSRLNRALTRKRLLRLSVLSGIRFSRSGCFTIVHRGATTVFTAYTLLNTRSIGTNDHVTRRTCLFKRGLNVTFRVGSSVFSCCPRAGVNGPASGSVRRNGLALPTVCTVGSAGSTRCVGVTREVQRHVTAGRRVGTLHLFAVSRNNVRCARSIYRRCISGSLRFVRRCIRGPPLHSTLVTCIGCSMSQSRWRVVVLPPAGDIVRSTG